VLLLGANSLVIAGVITVSAFLNTAVLIKFSKKYIKSLAKVNWPASLALLKNGLPYFLWSIFGVVYYRIDSVMLSLMTPDVVVGWYGVAYNFFDVLMFVPNILSIAIYPVLARLTGTDGAEKTGTTQKSLDFVFIIGIPISILTCAYSEFIIQLLFGLGQYQHSVLLLQIFAIGLLLVYIDWVLGTALLAFEKQLQWSFVAFIACLVNIGLNYVLIPYTQANAGNGGIGGAVATIVTEFFVMLSAIYLAPREFFTNLRINVQIKGVASGVIMLATILLLRQLMTPQIIQAVFCSAMYVASLFLMKTLDPQEIKFLREFFSLTNLKKTFILNRGK
jgi:O-antigen/teichoic acid export membrane protein